MIPSPFKLRVAGLAEALRLKDYALASRICDSLGRDLGAALLTDAKNLTALTDFTEASIRATSNDLEAAADCAEFVTAFSSAFAGIRTIASHAIKLLLLAGRFTEAEAVVATQGFRLDYQNHLSVLAGQPERVRGIEYLARHVLTNEPERMIDVLAAIHLAADTIEDLDRSLLQFGHKEFVFPTGRGAYYIRASRPISMIPRLIAAGISLDVTSLNQLPAFAGNATEAQIGEIIALLPVQSAVAAIEGMMGRNYSEDEAAGNVRAIMRKRLMERIGAGGYSFVLLRKAFDKKDAAFAALITPPGAPVAKGQLETLLKAVLDGYDRNGSTTVVWRDTIAWLRILKAWGADFTTLRRPMRETVELLTT